MEKHTIYAIIDDTGLPFYVGKSKNVQARRQGHISRVRAGSKLYLYNKLRKMIKDGREFDFVAIESGLGDDIVDEREQHHIRRLRAEGYKLCNIADDGEGGKGMTPETIAKIAAKNRGKKRTPDECERIRQMRLGTKHSAETRKKLSEAWHRTPEQIQKMIERIKESNTGRVNIQKFIITSPDGKEYVTEHGLKDFCRQHGLTSSNMSHVVSGKRKHHKGWKARHYDRENL